MPSNTWQDLCYGTRTLSRSPGFTAVAVVSLALGIGGVTTIFSVFNAIVLRPLPFEDPDRLVGVWQSTPGQRRSESAEALKYSTVVQLKKHSRLVERMAMTTRSWWELYELKQRRYVTAGIISVDMLPMLGVTPVLGRNIRLEDNPAPQSRAEGDGILLSHRFWQRHFGGNPAVLGQTLKMGLGPKTVVGVLPEGFWIFPTNNTPDLWIGWDILNRYPHERWLSTIARLKPGVSVEQARQELEAIARRADPATAAQPGWRLHVTPLHEWIYGSETRLTGFGITWSYKKVLLFLLGAVACVLLIGCANVANLMLVRAETRHKEIATRAALGAGRRRLIRQLLTESVLLATLGGLAGVLLAYGGIRLLIAFVPDWYPPTDEIRVDRVILGFAAGISLFTGVLFGLAPALRASRPNLNESLKEGARRSTSGPRYGIHSFLVVSEVGLALVLAVGAGLMISSIRRVFDVELGFNPDGLLRGSVSLHGPKYVEFAESPRADSSPNWARLRQRITPRVEDFYREVLEDIERLPGVRSVATIEMGRGYRLRILGGTPAARGEEPLITYAEVATDFFRTMETPLLRGRLFTDRDRRGAASVAIISESMARDFFQDQDPVGRQLQVSRPRSRVPFEDQIREVVGVVKDVRWNLRADPEPTVYVPFCQHASLASGHWTGKNLVARTAIDAASLIPSIREVVARADNAQVASLAQRERWRDIRGADAAWAALRDPMPMNQWLAEQASGERFWLRLLGFFSGLAVFLAAVGLYGVMSYSVARRTHEFGIRMALGARRIDVFQDVLKRGLTLSLAGVAIGVAVALALTRLLESQLHGVTPRDPATFATVSVLLIAVALLASYIPAHRATKVDPMVALRHE